jgi:hypothetical protein
MVRPAEDAATASAEVRCDVRLRAEWAGTTLGRHPLRAGTGVLRLVRNPSQRHCHPSKIGVLDQARRAEPSVA